MAGQSVAETGGGKLRKVGDSAVDHLLDGGTLLRCKSCPAAFGIAPGQSCGKKSILNKSHAG